MGGKPVEVIPQWMSTLLMVAGGFIFFLLAVNITSRIEVRRQTNKLLHSELRYRALLENYPDLIFRMNSDGVILDYHTSIKDDLITSPEEFLGKKVGDVLPQYLASATLEKVQQAIKTRRIQVLEYHLPMKDGIREYEARYSASGDAEVISIIRDITDRKLAEKKLQESEETLPYFSQGFSGWYFPNGCQRYDDLRQPNMEQNYRPYYRRSHGRRMVKISSP